MTEETQLNISQKMAMIQQYLKAPKGQTNNFGNYKYRSCEDIVEAVKPLLADSELYLIISDEIAIIGDRYYVKATAEVRGESACVRAVGFAREPLDKKGMDQAQITGATSSYARKYALNGLFAIDDTKDADTQDNQNAQTQEQMSPEPIDQHKIDNAYAAFKEVIDSEDKVENMNYGRIQAGYARLTNDEQMALFTEFGPLKSNVLGKDGKGLLYRSVIKNLLAIKGE